ncbi:LOW QUALITY PROTEIN: NACHT, LRR and PYD domains-containing protein 3-like [Rhynochetos jubatus]
MTRPTRCPPKPPGASRTTATPRGSAVGRRPGPSAVQLPPDELQGEVPQPPPTPRRPRLLGVRRGAVRQPAGGGLPTGVQGSKTCVAGADSTQGAGGDLLLRALEELSQENFKKFRDALARRAGGQHRIPGGQLERADCVDTKNLMVDSHGEEAALDVAIGILERIPLRPSADRLRDSRARGGEAPGGSGAPRGPRRQEPAVGAGGYCGEGGGWVGGRRRRGAAGGALPLLAPRTREVAARPPGYQSSYKRAVRQAYSRPKERNARVGDHVALNTRYLKLVMVSQHREEEERQHELVAAGRRHAELVKEQADASVAVQGLFKASPGGWVPKVVVLLGAAGVGKTLTARKITLDWASDALFPEFRYVFYLPCREGSLLTTEASVAHLIARCWPDRPPPVDEVLGRPEKLLFLINGFDELRFSFDCPRSQLRSDPWEPGPVAVTLSGLFGRSVLPESSLLVTTRPVALRRLGECLDCERYVEILGFSEAERKEYFQRCLDDAEPAAAAFRLVRANETLFTMCLVPIVCCTVCTIKQQLGQPSGLSRSLKTTTGIYILYPSALLRSLSGPAPGVLRRPCSLAADGVWKQKVLFEEKELREHALAQQEAFPLLLNEHLVQRDISCVSTYSFIHLSFQEFAALFYELEDGEGAAPPGAPPRDVKGLLESYGSARRSFVLTVRFLFGLLSEQHREGLEAAVGCRVAPRLARDPLEWLRGRQVTALVRLTRERAVVRELELCHCLHELQDRAAVAAAPEPLAGFSLRGLNLGRFHQAVLAFSLRHCPGLGSLDVGHCAFLRHEPPDPVGPRPAKLARWEEQLEEEKESPIHLLCEALEESGCELKTLSHRGCRGRGEGLLAAQRPRAAAAGMGSSPLRGVPETKRACGQSAVEGRFDQCGLMAACCEALAPVLGAKPTLTELDLSGNEGLGDDGARLLCEGLRRGARRLQTLRSSLEGDGGRAGTPSPTQRPHHRDNTPGDTSRSPSARAMVGLLQRDGRRELTATLGSVPGLAQLDLGDNPLGDGGLRELCGALLAPGGLQKLWLWRCRLMEASCGALATVLPHTPSLTELHLGDNELGAGGSRSLSQGLRDPACRLQTLSLWQSRLSGACGEDLCATLGASRSLRHLDLSQNLLGDRSVRQLCAALGQPSCVLQRLWLTQSGLSKETQQQLDALKAAKPNLSIGYI